MGWEWKPETPEEIAEHQRMRKNLIECQQMYDNKNKGFEKSVFKRNQKPRSILVRLAIVVVGIYLICNGGFTVPKSEGTVSRVANPVGLTNVANEENNSDLSVHPGKYVSQNASKYIQQVNSVVAAYEKFCVILNTDLQSDGMAEYTDYAENIDDFLTEIETLKKMNIYRHDPLNSYQAVCEKYFSVPYSFFSSAKQCLAFSITEYNLMIVKLNSLDTPFTHLVSLFEEKGYYYQEANGLVSYRTQSYF